MAWLIIALFGGAAALAGLFAFSREQSHFFAAGFTPQERIALISSGERQPGLSSLTQRRFMVDCRNSVIQAARLALPEAERTALAEACLTAARSVAEASPASSFAWFAIAHAALALGDWDELNEALKRSQATGTNEGWIARYRVELVEDNRSRISEDYFSQHLADLAVLGSNMGAYHDFLATIYVRRPNSRADLTNAIETLPPQNQRMFLNSIDRVRRSLQAGQS